MPNNVGGYIGQTSVPNDVHIDVPVGAKQIQDWFEGSAKDTPNQR
ncbi:MAG: hypothetical protein QM765_30695 [Myxococcales bacterium]